MSGWLAIGIGFWLGAWALNVRLARARARWAGSRSR